MLPTSKYYEVFRDLINEVCELFKLKYFHLGMEKEKSGDAKRAFEAK